MNVESVFLFLIKHSHESEFQRLMTFPNLISRISKKVKDRGIKMAFLPEKYSRISPLICALLVFLVEECAFINECFVLVCAEGKLDLVSRLTFPFKGIFHFVQPVKRDIQK